MMKVYKPDAKLSIEKQIEAVLTLAKQKNEIIFADFKGVQMMVAPSMTVEMAMRLYKRLAIKNCVNVNDKIKSKGS